MARFFDYAVIRLAPSNARDERLNIGAVIFKPDSLDVRLCRRLEKIRAISASLNADTLKEVVESLGKLDDYTRERASCAVAARHEALSRVGPLALSALGQVAAINDDQYEARVEALLRDLVDPEPAPKLVREKRSRLLTQVKKALARERVMARKDEGLDAHRVVPKYEVGEGLVADLVLQNGQYHVLETVDVSREEESLRRAIGEIGASALTLESSRLRFGTDNTNGRLVYSASSMIERQAKGALDAVQHQGYELINWASQDARAKLISTIMQLATPLPSRRTSRRVATDGMQSFFH